MKKRDIQILEIVTQKNRIEVSKLAEMLGVSQVTIRKDLDGLEDRGLVQRQHGYALLGSRDDINNRLAIHYEVKRSIAQVAMELVQDGESIMIESGSSCTLLAEQLIHQRSNVTIITNSAFIAGYIRKQNPAKILLLGGEYQLESQVMVGPLLRKCAADFSVDKLFIGADGFSSGTGFTGRDLARAEAVQNMAERAKRTIVLTDSSKFRQTGVVALLPEAEVDTVVTDEDIPKDVETLLVQRGIHLLKASKP